MFLLVCATFNREVEVFRPLVSIYCYAASSKTKLFLLCSISIDYLRKVDDDCIKDDFFYFLSGGMLGIHNFFLEALGMGMV